MPDKVKAVPKVKLGAPRYYLNRELSELEFHRRVLFEAMDERNPLMERVRFLSIFSSNLDEFFMKRVGGLKRQMAAQISKLPPDALSPHEQWEEILKVSHDMFDTQMKTYKEQLRPALAEYGIEIVHHKNLRRSDKKYLRTYFKEKVFPVLTPLAVDPGHPFPFISNLSLSLAVLTQGRKKHVERFARVKIPPTRPRLVEIKDSLVLVPLEQIVVANLDLLFPGVEVLYGYPFRVTRNADVKRDEEEAVDLLEMIQEELRQRRFATVVRLEVDQRMPKSMRRLLMQGLEITEDEIFDVDGFIDFSPFLSLTRLGDEQVQLRRWEPRSHPRLRHGVNGDSTDIFREIRSGDILVHHPYHAFSETVYRFVKQASEDPRVLAIKMVVYRTARDSQVLRSLLRAVENGKQVAVMVELRARFDEELNIEWVNTLEEAGVHVAYGMVGFKTHCKITSVVRDEEEGLRTYVHIATGNYHSETANFYTDLGLLTADPEISKDVSHLFNFLTGHARTEKYRKLLVAPFNMKETFVKMIRREAALARKGKEARIIAKINSLEDPDLVRELYRASRSGVRVDLIVRGICRLRPGLEGVSDNIRIVSVVGRFLEHSRIFYFLNGGDPRYFIGSADWMQRNLVSRIEAAVPIEDPDLQTQLDEILQIMLSDNRKSWIMKSDGSYRQRRPRRGEEEFNAQEVLMELTEEILHRNGAGY